MLERLGIDKLVIENKKNQEGIGKKNMLMAFFKAFAKSKSNVDHLQMPKIKKVKSIDFENLSFNEDGNHNRKKSKTRELDDSEIIVFDLVESQDFSQLNE